MKKNPIATIQVILVLMFFLSFGLNAQSGIDSSNIVLLKTTFGGEYYGNIVGETSTHYLFKTLSSNVAFQFNKTAVKKIEKVENASIKNGKLWYDNPQAARYMWAPNGYALHRGEAYYQNIWVVFNQVSYGVTDEITLGFGMIPTFLLGADFVPVWITPKVSFPLKNEKFHLGAGAVVAYVVGESEGPFGLLYGISYGTKDKNISLGLGYGFFENEWTKNPVSNISTMLRTGHRGYFITESYFYAQDGEFWGVSIIGGRT